MIRIPLLALTHDELDAAVESLARVGGVYDLIAAVVEAYERPRCGATA